MENIAKMMFEDQMDELVEMDKVQSYDNLMQIHDNLQNYTPEEISVIMDFLCHDKKFQEITGGDPAKLHEYLYKKQEASFEWWQEIHVVKSIIETGFFVWAIIRYSKQKTPVGVAEWAARNGARSVQDEMFTYKARVPTMTDFQLLQAALTKSMPLVAKIIDGKKVTDAELSAGIRTLGITGDIRNLDNYNGLPYALLMMFLKDIGFSIVATGVVIILSALSLGVLYIPVTLAASMWQGTKTAAGFKRAYEEWNGGDSLLSKGWNTNTFTASINEFLKHYNAVKAFATKLNTQDEHDGSLYSRAEGNRVRAFCDLVYVGLKVEAKILGAVIAVTDRQLDMAIIPK